MGDGIPATVDLLGGEIVVHETATIFVGEDVGVAPEVSKLEDIDADVHFRLEEEATTVDASGEGFVHPRREEASSFGPFQ